MNCLDLFLLTFDQQRYFNYHIAMLAVETASIFSRLYASWFFKRLFILGRVLLIGVEVAPFMSKFLWLNKPSLKVETTNRSCETWPDRNVLQMGDGPPHDFVSRLPDEVEPKPTA